MAMQETGGVPAPATTPPTLPAELVASPRPTGWPMVIGVIAIVIGALGALGGLCGAASPWFAGFIMNQMPEAQRGAIEVTQKWWGWTVTAYLVSTAVAILLLVAGAGLVRRRAWARRTCINWAVLKMLLVVATTAMSYPIARETSEVTLRPSASAPSTPVNVQQFAELGMIVGLTFGLLWGWALPVFLLIWFARGKIRNEVAGWA